MSVNFCTKCGQRLQHPARFCDNCGTPVEDTGRGESPSAVRQPLTSGSAGLGFEIPRLFRDSTAQETDTRPWGINTFELKTMLSCSLLDAPLDTGFLLCKRPDRELCKLVPLFYVDGMQGLKVLGCSNVSYYIDDAEYTYVADESRSALAKGVSEAYIAAQKDPVCRMNVYIHFKPREEDSKADFLQGRWATCIDQNDMRDVRANLQLPLSGLMLKQRLREHERWASAILARVRDAQLQAILNRVVTSMRAAQQRIPDGFAHDIHCVAYYTHNRECQNTVLIAEEPEQAEPAGLPARAPQQALRMLGGEAGLGGERTPKGPQARLFSETAFTGSVRRP